MKQEVNIFHVFGAAVSIKKTGLTNSYGLAFSAMQLLQISNLCESGPPWSSG